MLPIWIWYTEVAVGSEMVDIWVNAHVNSTPDQTIISHTIEREDEYHGLNIREARIAGVDTSVVTPEYV